MNIAVSAKTKLDVVPLTEHIGADDPRAAQLLAQAAQAVDGAYRRSAEIMGQDENRVVGEYASGSQINDVDDSFAWRFLYAFWRLCEQRIGGVEALETNHAARVVAERAGLSPQVRVVRLRQRDERTPGEPVARNWQHRWVVRMHKVRQWYPSEQRHKVIYRGPYVKGPDGRILKPSKGGDARYLLSFLPQSNLERPPYAAPADPVEAFERALTALGQGEAAATENKGFSHAR